MFFKEVVMVSFGELAAMVKGEYWEWVTMGVTGMVAIVRRE